ncbi:MAG TPA: methionine--tRNA ligase [Rhodanobacteraceae bacterium]|nr:methionine--tRNA ligase [Rhodanobacteraceae bacterium]
MKPRKILVTNALPYANGPIHLGHMLENIQTDIWVRAMRMAGHEVHYVCADDAHGTSIMLRAEKEGITPQALIAGVLEQHKRDLADFGIAHDHYSTTDSDSNRSLTYRIWNALVAAGHTESKPVKQLYDPVKDMFLPDRFIKGECPNCHSKDQYGDSCEVCGKTYNPTELIEPYSVVSGAKPVERESTHFFVKLADFETMLQGWLKQRESEGGLQSEVVNKLQEWFADGLRSWDVSRDAPYFGFEIPGQPGKYFYVWVDAPIGYLSSFRDYCAAWNAKHPDTPLRFEDFVERDDAAKAGTEMVHFIGKDIIYFHTLFWPAMLHGAGLRTPTAVNVHGFMTVDGAKMSKSRGTFINARTYLDHLDPDYLRYYLATLLGPTLADLDLDLKAFEERVNSHLVGKWVNIASRTAGFVHKFFGGKLAGALPDVERERHEAAARRLGACAALFEARDYAAATRLIVEVADEANGYVAEKAPWLLAKDEAKRDELHAVCTMAINYFRLLSIYLAPIVPKMAGLVAANFLDTTLCDFRDAGTLLLGHAIRPFTTRVDRIDPKKIEAMIEASKESLKPADSASVSIGPDGTSPSKTTASVTESPASAGSAAASDAASRSQASAASRDAGSSSTGTPASPDAAPPAISIDDFSKLDLRIGKVLACEPVEGSDKLLRFELDAGDLGKRQIFSGIRAAYADPAKLVGRSVVFIANLTPRKMRFGVSEGMILSAGSGGADLFLLDADEGAQAGMPVK